MKRKNYGVKLAFFHCMDYHFFQACLLRRDFQKNYNGSQAKKDVGDYGRGRKYQRI